MPILPFFIAAATKHAYLKKPCAAAIFPTASPAGKLFDKAEIKDVLAYVRLLLNPTTIRPFLRAVTTPRRGVGDVTLAKLNAYAQIAHCQPVSGSQSMEALAELNSKNREHLQQFMALMQAHQSRAASEAAGSLLQNLLQDIGYENHLCSAKKATAKIKWRNVQDLAAWIGRKGEEDGKNILEITKPLR